MISRRSFCAFVAGAAVVRPASLLAAEAKVDPAAARTLRAQAERALALHASRIAHDDMIGIVDFAAPSREPRFRIIERATGRTLTMLVSHGRGSDPTHSGWLHSFSNEPGSKASSAGAYLTGEIYEGRHGRSRRLIGLDASNSNAETRGLVIHAADYVSPAMAASAGKIGRSEGCLAVAPGDRDKLLDMLGPGRLIFAGRA